MSKSNQRVLWLEPYVCIAWFVCDGAAPIGRSLRLFRAVLNGIPDSFSPRDLFVLARGDNPATRAIVVDLASVRVDYGPQIDAGAASNVLSAYLAATLLRFTLPTISLRHS